MACFSCGESHNNSEQTVLSNYKKYYEKTGKEFYFFKKIDTNETKIMSKDDFNQFYKANKKDFQNKEYEYARISELKLS